MQWFGIIFLIWFVFFYKRRKSLVYSNPEPEYYYQALTKSEQDQVERIVLRTLKKYPDAMVGEIYPELVYEALNFKLQTGQITKSELEKELKKITDKIII